jgi:hypothetical protein
MSFSGFWMRNQVAMRHFDGHRTVQLLVMGQVDPPKAVFTQKSFDPIATDVVGLLVTLG